MINIPHNTVIWLDFRTTDLLSENSGYFVSFNDIVGVRHFYRAKFLPCAGDHVAISQSRNFYCPARSTDYKMLAQKEKESDAVKRISDPPARPPIQTARGVIYLVIYPEIKIHPIKNSKYPSHLVPAPWIMLFIGKVGRATFGLTDKGNSWKRIFWFQRSFASS